MTTTDGSGDFTFTGITGPYLPLELQIAETPQPGWIQTDPQKPYYLAIVGLNGHFNLYGINFGNRYIGDCDISLDTCLAGRIDNFDDSDGPELASPSDDLFPLLIEHGPVVPFDATDGNAWSFGHTFTDCWDPCCYITNARLCMRLKAANTVAWPEDELWLGGWSDVIWSNWATRMQFWRISLDDLIAYHTNGADPTWDLGDEMTVCLDLGDLPLPDSDFDVTNILPALQSGELSVVIVGQTEVDYLELEFGVCCLDTVYATGDINGDDIGLQPADAARLADFLRYGSFLSWEPYEADLNGDCVIDDQDLQLYLDYFTYGLSVFDPYGGYPVQTCCNPDTTRGACCLPGGGCLLKTEQECLAAGGTYLDDGSRCYPFYPCPLTAGLDTVTIFGLPHISLGGAILDTAGGVLTITGIDSAGGDGVRIGLGESQGFSYDWAPTPPDENVFTTEILTGQIAAVPDQVLGTSGSVWFGDSGAVSVDFTPAGITSYRVEIFDGDSLVHTTTGHSGRDISYALIEPPKDRLSKGDPMKGKDIAIFRKPDEGLMSKSYRQFESYGHMEGAAFTEVVAIHDGSGIHVGDRINLRGEQEPDFDFFSDIVIVLTNRDTLVITDERLWLFGLPHTALGPVTFDAAGGNLTVGNIGSSGADGVSIGLGQAPQWDAAWNGLDPGGTLPTGAYVTVTAIGQVDGTPDQAIGTGKAEKVGSDWQVSADFSPIGNTTQTILITNGGTLVDSVSGHTGPAALAALAPDDWHWDNKRDALNKSAGPSLINHPGGCTGTWSTPLTITLLGAKGARTVTGDAVVMIPEDHTAQSDFFSDIVIRAADIPEITFTDMSACGCNCHADPQCDGFPDVFDIVHAVNVGFRNDPDIGDPNPNCPRNTTDVDCDGDTDVFDIVRFVNVAFRNEAPEDNFCDPCAP